MKKNALSSYNVSQIELDYSQFGVLVNGKNKIVCYCKGLTKK